MRNSIIILIYVLYIASLDINSQTMRVNDNIPSCNIANMLIDNNNSRDIKDVMDYYGWNCGNDKIVWKNRIGDEIRVKASVAGREIERVELLTSENMRLSDRLATLQYMPADDKQKEPVPEYEKTPKEMYASGRKRVAVYRQGDRILMVFFRSREQGYTRFGPLEDNNSQ